MGLLDNYTGIGMSPRPLRQHQHIMRCLVIGLNDEGVYALSEQCVDPDDLDSQAPDVCIYDDQEDQCPHIIVEITTHKQLSAIKKKVVQLMEDYPSVLEAFVYDYEKQRWYCFGSELDARYPSYSEILETDFNKYL